MLRLDNEQDFVRDSTHQDDDSQDRDGVKSERADATAAFAFNFECETKEQSEQAVVQDVTPAFAASGKMAKLVEGIEI